MKLKQKFSLEDLPSSLDIASSPACLNQFIIVKPPTFKAPSLLCHSAVQLVPQMLVGTAFLISQSNQAQFLKHGRRGWIVWLNCICTVSLLSSVPNISGRPHPRRLSLQGLHAFNQHQSLHSISSTRGREAERAQGSSQHCSSRYPLCFCRRSTTGIC